MLQHRQVDREGWLEAAAEAHGRAISYDADDGVPLAALPLNENLAADRPSFLEVLQRQRAIHNRHPTRVPPVGSCDDATCHRGEAQHAEGVRAHEVVSRGHLVQRPGEAALCAVAAVGDHDIAHARSHQSAGAGQARPVDRLQQSRVLLGPSLQWRLGCGDFKNRSVQVLPPAACHERPRLALQQRRRCEGRETQSELQRRNDQGERVASRVRQR